MVQVSHEVTSRHVTSHHDGWSGLARAPGTRCGAPRCTSGRGSSTTSRITTQSPSWASGARSAATWRPGPGTRGSWCANPGEETGGWRLAQSALARQVRRLRGGWAQPLDIPRHGGRAAAGWPQHVTRHAPHVTRDKRQDTRHKRYSHDDATRCMTQDRENKEDMRPRGHKTRYKTQDKITRPMTLKMEKTQDKTEEAT